MKNQILSNYKLLLYILLFIIVVSCDYSYVYKQIIFNKTDDTIFFDFGKKSYHHPDGLLICFPNTENFYYENQYVFWDTLSLLCPIDIRGYHAVDIWTSSGKKLTKDWKQTDNWVCEKLNNFNIYLSFIITEEDLE